LKLGDTISGWIRRVLAVGVVLAAVPFALAHVSHKKPVRAKTAAGKKAVTGKGSSARHLKRVRRKGSWKRHGQQTVDGRRTEQIQEALIQSHYLDGEPSGTWDAKTQEALRRYQAANGWQSKVVPDSRALIKMGLGPSNDKLLNPDSAMTSQIDAPPAESKRP
jgi:peptidoglycan hydrolase-like protein with peptidoglycan-binding domain